MRDKILLAAQHLMQVNGTTTNLEIKNYLHAENTEPNFVLTQADVSAATKQLAKEHDWDADYNGTYTTYSIKSPLSPTNSTVSTNTHVDPNDPFVGYLASNKGVYVTGSDKNDVRYKLFHLANDQFNMGISYDDINFCTQEYYNNHHKN